MPHRSRRITSYLWLLLNTITWGAAFIVSKPALDHTSPNLFMFYRLFLAGLIMLPFLVYWLKDTKLRRMLPTILGVEFVGNVLCLAFLYEGLARSTAIETGLISTTAPIFIVLAGVLILREKQTRREWFGLGVTFFGVLLITLYPIMNGGAQLGALSLVGNGFIIASNILTGVYVVLAKKFYKGVNKLYAASVSFVSGAAAFGVLSLWQAGSVTAVVQQIQLDWSQPTVWYAVLYMGIVGSIIGLTSYIKGQDGIEASEAGLFYYLHPIIYIPMGVWLLKEPFTWIQALGLGFVLVGVLIAEQPFSKKRR